VNLASNYLEFTVKQSKKL